jgi:hypothetical protein
VAGALLTQVGGSKAMQLMINQLQERPIGWGVVNELGWLGHEATDLRLLRQDCSSIDFGVHIPLLKGRLNVV